MPVCMCHSGNVCQSMTYVKQRKAKNGAGGVNPLILIGVGDYLTARSEG